jgi:hypothetical protein
MELQTMRHTLYKPQHNRRPVTALGYLPQKETQECILQEEINSYATGKMRAPALREVSKFVNLYKEGTVLKITLRDKSFKATLLGYRQHSTRGWIMGVLMCEDGVVKDITIDPTGYKDMEGVIIESMYDPEAKIVCFVTPYYSILQVSPAA